MGIFNFLKKLFSPTHKVVKKTKKKQSSNSKEVKLRVHQDELESIGVITHYKGNPFTGIAYDLHENGQLKEEMIKKNGKPDGISREYYENGCLSLVSKAKNGKFIGMKFWNEDGSYRECIGADFNSKSAEKSLTKKTEASKQKKAVKKPKPEAVQDYQIEYEKMASDFDQLMSEHRSWHDIIVQRADTMKNLAQSLHQSLKEITAEWTQSHFEEYKSKGGDIKEAKEGIILRLEAYGHIYTCNQDYLKKMKSFISKYSEMDVKPIEDLIESTVKWDIASAQASLMGSILFAQSLGMEDAEIMKYASIESFPEYVPGKTYEEIMDDIEREAGLRD